MTDEEIFKEVYPGALIEARVRRGSRGKRYYLVRKNRGAEMWSGWGDTKAQAWYDAVRRLKLKEIRGGNQNG